LPIGGTGVSAGVLGTGDGVGTGSAVGVLGIVAANASGISSLLAAAGDDTADSAAGAGVGTEGAVSVGVKDVSVIVCEICESTRGLAGVVRASSTSFCGSGKVGAGVSAGSELVGVGVIVCGSSAIFITSL
jgi:hypothetical protein